MATPSRWNDGPLVAWTESDGPGRARRTPGVRVLGAAIVAAAVAGWGLFTANEVCPEHALLIDVAAGTALVLVVAAGIAALRSSVMAAPLVLAASILGLTVGVVDTMHDVTRQRVIAVASAVAAVVAAYSAVLAVGAQLWGHRAVRQAAQPIRVDLVEVTHTEPAATPTPGGRAVPSVVDAPSSDSVAGRA